MISRFAYRSRQFWEALLASQMIIQGDVLTAHLTPNQMALFQRMQKAEKAHAWQVFKHLETAGQTDPDLLVAALLHDVGKTLHPLSIIDRVIIVLGNRLFPQAARRWATGTPDGLRLAFVVAAKHARWGAELASQAGASPESVDLIRHHHDKRLPIINSHHDRLLAVLQEADNES